MTAKMERQSECHSKNLLNSLERLQMNGKLCDVTIAIGDEEMKVHRTILIAASEYFEAMFAREMKESQTGKIDFPSTPPEVVKLCMGFIYTGKAEFSLENTEELIHASDMMQLHDLTNLYIEFLIENLNVENCVEYLMLVWTYGKNLFDKPIENFISKNCPDFTKAKKFELLSKEHLVYCLKLLPKANRTSETHKWKAIIAWVKSDSENRKNVFVELFELLDLSMLSKEFLKDEIYEEQLVNKSLVCSNMMLECLLAKEKTGSLTSAEDEPVKFTSIYALSNTIRALHRYSSVTKQWSKETDLPEDIHTGHNFSDLEVFNNSIYMGFGNSLWKYNRPNWTELYALNNTLPCYNRCIVHNGSVYMVTSNYMVEYNIGKGTVSGEIAPGPRIKGKFAVTCAAGSMYAMGGSYNDDWDPERTLTSRFAYEFNFKTKIWQQIGSLTAKRDGSTAFCFGNKPYVLGGTVGKYNVDSVEFYEPSTNQWNTVPDLKITCTSGKAYKHGKLYVFLPGFQFQAVEFSRLQAQAKNGLMVANLDSSKACVTFS